MDIFYCGFSGRPHKINAIWGSKYTQVYQPINWLDALEPVKIVCDMMAFSYKSRFSKTIKILQDCLRNSKHQRLNRTTPTSESFHSALNSSDGFSFDTIYGPSYLHQVIDNPERCSTQFPKYQSHYNSYLIRGMHITHLQNYEDAMKHIFMNGTFDYRSNDNYKRYLQEGEKY